MLTYLPSCMLQRRARQDVRELAMELAMAHVKDAVPLAKVHVLVVAK